MTDQPSLADEPLSQMGVDTVQTTSRPNAMRERMAAGMAGEGMVDENEGGRRVGTWIWWSQLRIDGPGTAGMSCVRLRQTPQSAGQRRDASKHASYLIAWAQPGV